MQRLHVDGRLRRAIAGDKNFGSSALKLRLPRCDLIGVDVKLLGKFRQSSIAFERGNCSAVVLAWRACRQAEIPLIVLCRFPRPALITSDLSKQLRAQLKPSDRSHSNQCRIGYRLAPLVFKFICQILLDLLLPTADGSGQ